MVALQNKCLCGSGEAFAGCCAKFLAGDKNPLTAEELMRSRYTAHVVRDVRYLRDTLTPEGQAGFDGLAVGEFAASNHWTGLKVLRTKAGRADDSVGFVLFEARYVRDGKSMTLREYSRFEKHEGRWRYDRGVPEPGAK